MKAWSIYDIDSIVIYQHDKDEDACDVSFLYMAKLCQKVNVILPKNWSDPNFINLKYFKEQYWVDILQADKVYRIKDR